MGDKLIIFTNVQASHLEPSGATTSFRCRRSSCSPHQLQVIQYMEYSNQQVLFTVARVLDEPYSQLIPVSGVAVQARQST